MCVIDRYLKRVCLPVKKKDEEPQVPMKVGNNVTTNIDTALLGILEVYQSLTPVGGDFSKRT